MKVLVDARLAARGLGIASVSERLVAALQARSDVEVSLNATSYGWTPLGRLDTLRRSGMLDLHPRWDLRGRRHDLVHYLGNTAPRWGGAASVVTVHDLMMLDRSDASSRVFRELLIPGLTRSQARLVAISSRTAEELVARLGIRRDRILVIPHGRRVRPLPTGDRGHVLMFGGSTDPRKRVDLGFAVYRRYAEKLGPRALPLMVPGRSGVSQQHLEIVAGLPVTVVRDPSSEELERMLGHAACLLYPTQWEGFGLPLIEAGEVGTPVVADSSADLPPEVLGRHVSLVDSVEVDVWARALAAAVSEGPVPDPLTGSIPLWSEVADAYVAQYREASGIG